MHSAIFCSASRHPTSSSRPTIRSRCPAIPIRPALWEWLLTGILCRLTFLSHTVHAGGSVAACDQGHLEAALAGGGTVTFACGGVIVLTTTINVTADTFLDGRGQSVVLSGNDSVRLFNVASNVRFTLIDLTLAPVDRAVAQGDAQNPVGHGEGGAAEV